jgi:hypothetical protein
VRRELRLSSPGPARGRPAGLPPAAGLAFRSSGCWRRAAKPWDLPRRGNPAWALAPTPRPSWQGARQRRTPGIVSSWSVPRGWESGRERAAHRPGSGRSRAHPYPGEAAHCLKCPPGVDKATFRSRPGTRQAAHGPVSTRRGLLCRPTWPRFGGDFFGRGGWRAFRRRADLHQRPLLSKKPWHNVAYFPGSFETLVAAVKDR